MKKIYVLIFVILILGIKSCTNDEKQIIFIRGERLNSIGEISFLNDIRDSDFNFKEVVVGNNEEFLKYLSENVKSQKSRNKLFVVSDLFSDLSYDMEDYYGRLVYINRNEEGVFDLRIDQRYVSYLFGVVSGMVTRTNNISVIYSSEIESSFDNVLAFISGVKKVNPRVYDILKTGENILDIGSLSYDESMHELKEFVLGNVSDIVFYLEHELLTEASDIMEQNMKYLITLDSFEENIFLDVDYRYEDIINDIFKGNVKPYSINLINSSIDIDFSKLPEDIKQVVDSSLNEILNGRITLPMSMDELKTS